MSDTKLVEYQSEDHIATITMNRPDKGNGMSLALLAEMSEAIEAVESDDSVRVVILRSAGKNFCVGADLSDKGLAAKPADEHILQDHAPHLSGIKNSSKVYICAVQGAAAGIGSAYAMVCDFTLMARSAYLYQAFLPIGMVPDGGATWLLGRQLGYKRAFKMMIEGTKLDAQTCLDWGLASDIVELEELEQETTKLAHLIASKAPLAVAATKQLLHGVFSDNYENTIEAEAAKQKVMAKSADSAEGIAAFFEKRTATFRGE